MAQVIGQYRFTDPGSCLHSIQAQSNKEYKAISVGGEDSGTSFRDIVINCPFQRDLDYYCKVKIPQDVNYENKINFKLFKASSVSSNTMVYQYIKTVTVNRGGTGENVYAVVLFEDPRDNVVRAAVPISVNILPDYCLQGELYYVTPTGHYYIGDGGNALEVVNFNDVSLLASWKQEATNNYMTVELVFRPVEDGFNGIIVEIVRGAEDYNIQRVTEDGVSFEYGRKIDIDSFDYDLYRVNNLVDSMNKDGTLSRVGINSHPELLTVINGEEIYLGPSGIYELDALPIESLGIIATSFEDNFIIDYQYETGEGV